jgi:fucose 4-O-acetylase-like acetyltransferase
MDPLKAIGECSLAIYLLHYAIILKIIEPLNIRLTLPEYLAGYFVLLIAMILVAYILRYIRKSWRNQPFLVRFLIGS